MEDAWKKELAKIVAGLNNAKGVEALLAALLTPSEQEELARRWQIVKRLMNGLSQREVRDELSVSIATVTRGSRELRYGNGMFQKIYKQQTKK